MNRYFFIFFAFWGAIGIHNVYSQVQVNPSPSIINLVKSLEGPGVLISNISWHIPSGFISSPLGSFKDPGNYTGLEEGLLITTGSAKIAEGPNDFGSDGQDNFDFTFDSDLQQFSGGLDLYDLCYVQFDVVTSSSTLSFDYVFASEEYPEYLEYNDVFALMISGPGIAGTKNLALVPNTNIPVSVSNINHLTNSQYYRGNSSFTPWIQYDGMTVVLTASTEVIPCQTYRIKLAIADASDHIYDSGVFIKQGSFKSEEPPIISVVYEHPEFNYAIEGCNKAVVKFERPATMSDTINLVYKIVLTGTATNSVDYTFVKDSIVIPPGEPAGYFMIDAIDDHIKEGEEIVRILIASSCPQFPDIASYEIPVRDVFPYSIPSEAVCFRDSIQLHTNPDLGISALWETNSNLSCKNCLSPYAQSDINDHFTYTITHNSSGCNVTDSVLVEVVKIIPDFSHYSDPCYTSSDITFTNNSTSASQYLWSFGDGEISTEANPVHEYPANTTKGSVQYTVKLIASSSSPAVCSEEITRIITISEPFFIPNLLTADNNGKNEEFKISGIGGECWTLYLYNRWGGLVYKKENYTDEFKGSEVEAGNYYYLIENGNKDRSFSGWIHVVGNPQ